MTETKAPYNTKPAPSKIRPNTFQTPNLLTDDGLLALLTGSETKCYLVIIRKTFGWRKDRDRIAKSQIAQTTGLSEGTVDDCMESLVKFGLVLITSQNNQANEGLEWEPQIDDQQIDLAGLQARQDNSKAANIKRMEKARSARGGVVGLPHPEKQKGVGLSNYPTLLDYPGGGVVGLPPQQPINSVLVVVNQAFGEICTQYEHEIGALTPMIADAIQDAVDTYPVDWIPEAIGIAVEGNHRSWAYVEGILKNCLAKQVRPSLNKLEVKNGNHRTGDPKRTVTPKPGITQPTAADLAAAAEINRRANLQAVR